MLTEEVILALIGTLSGGGFLTVALKAIVDHRDKVSGREADAEERTERKRDRDLAAERARNERLQKRVDALLDELAEERNYSSECLIVIARAGLQEPQRRLRRER